MNYEQPLPVLDVCTEEIVLETKDAAAGTLTVKNTGGGILKGYLCSRHPALVFEPDWWEGNHQLISYSVNTQLAGLLPGQSFETTAFICSNGGETHLPVSVKLTKMAIATQEGQTIANIEDFYRYALAHPLQARQVFTDSEFYMLLLAVGYPYMEVYENLHKDANRERAMDNFFLLSGLKNKTTLTLPKNHFLFEQNPGDTGKIYGQIIAEKSDRGFFEATITPETAPPWLSLSANRLISSDFDAENRARVNFCIDPEKITTRYANEKVRIGYGTEGEDAMAELVFRRPPAFSARLNRDTYRYDDKGVIEIFNQTGADLGVEVFCPDNYIRFTARSYMAGAYYEIPFTVKLSAFMNAGRLFRKTPFMRTNIELKGASPGKVFKFALPIEVGEW